MHRLFSDHSQSEHLQFALRRVALRIAVLTLGLVVISGCGVAPEATVNSKVEKADSPKPVARENQNQAPDPQVKINDNPIQQIENDMKQTRNRIGGVYRRTKNTINKIEMRGQVDFETQRQYQIVVDSYLACVRDKNKPPHDWKELKRYCNSIGKDQQAITAAKRSGLEIFWDANIDKDSAVGHGLEIAIAYQRSAAVTQGWVLFANGNVAKVGPDEFNELTSAEK